MTAFERGRWFKAARESALAFAAGTAFFAAVAVLLAVANADVFAIVVGAVCVAAILAIARRWGVAYAVPIAMVSLLAFDWYEFPPTHAREFPSGGNLVDLAVYLATSVLIGELAAYAERARGVLADEQAALRHVATLAAREAPPGEVFAAIVAEVGPLLSVDRTAVVRCVDGVFEEVDDVPRDLADEVARTRGPVERVLSAGVPIVFDDHVWGVILAWSTQPLRSNAAACLEAFADLAATSLSTHARRDELAQRAREQAALHRVAALVAREAPPEEVLAEVAHEAGEPLGVDGVHLGRYELDGTTVGVGSWTRAGDQIPPGTRAPVDANSVTTRVFRSGHPERRDSYDGVSGAIVERLRALGLRSSVGAPIVVGEQLWGVMVTSTKGEQPLPADTEARMVAFTELVTTAIANVRARAEVRRLADEQAALRRVATLVASEAAEADVLALVAEEVTVLFGSHATQIYRFEANGTVTSVATSGLHFSPDGWTPDDDSALARIYRTRLPVRVDDYDAIEGSYAARVRAAGVQSAVAVPVMVDGRLWGAISLSSKVAHHLPAESESCLTEFAALVQTAISNLHSRSELAASRARIVAAADDERRRVVRDLHDGAQQRLVHTVITLKLARNELERESKFLEQALHEAEQAMAELRELAHGILPSVLSHGGLRAGVQALASRMPVPVDVGVSVARLPRTVEATAYFVVAEALTNVAKYASAQRVEVTARVDDGTLLVAVCDDGLGGAQAGGSGLLGLADRLAAVDGRLEVESPPGGGTRLAAAIPLRAET